MESGKKADQSSHYLITLCYTRPKSPIATLRVPKPSASLVIKPQQHLDTLCGIIRKEVMTTLPAFSLKKFLRFLILCLILNIILFTGAGNFFKLPDLWVFGAVVMSTSSLGLIQVARSLPAKTKWQLEVVTYGINLEPYSRTICDITGKWPKTVGASLIVHIKTRSKEEADRIKTRVESAIQFKKITLTRLENKRKP